MAVLRQIILDNAMVFLQSLNIAYLKENQCLLRPFRYVRASAHRNDNMDILKGSRNFYDFQGDDRQSAACFY